MWDGRLPTVAELQREGQRLGLAKPGWRVYWLCGYTWVTKEDKLGHETIVAGLDERHNPIYLSALNIGELILEAAGVR